MKSECIPIPGKEMWESIALIFEQRVNFPHCLGAVDGKHIRIINPLGSMYHNYKCYASVVLMATADSEYCDSHILKKCSLWTSILNNHLELPNEKYLKGRASPKVPYFFIVDEAFAIHKHLLRPFRGSNLTLKQRIFNYCLCRARRYVECKFNILSYKCRILIWNPTLLLILSRLV